MEAFGFFHLPFQCFMVTGNKYLVEVKITILAIEI
ncbi:hypothetical protein BA6E_125146 [Bacteroidales bacterium 6E]|nr:hypothetical protein BA6E_125146 [Bacteroidales bacterium 6E]